MVDYTALSHRIAALCEHETNDVALMATIVCEVHHSDDRFDWTGFYRVTEPQVLKIGPYQGGMGVWLSLLHAGYAALRRAAKRYRLSLILCI